MLHNIGLSNLKPEKSVEEFSRARVAECLRRSVDSGGKRAKKGAFHSLRLSPLSERLSSVGWERRLTLIYRNENGLFTLMLSQKIVERTNENKTDDLQEI